MQIVIEIILKYWKYVLIGFLIGLVYIMYNRIQYINSDNERLSNNVSELKLNIKDQQLLLTKDEFKLYYKDLVKEISDSLKIKGKQINQVTNVYNAYFDSSRTFNTTNQISDSLYRITVDEPCFGFSGLHNTKSKVFTLEYRRFNDTLRVVDYYTRKRLFNVSWFPKWGHKQYMRDSYSKCGSSVKTEQITILKK